MRLLLFTLFVFAQKINCFKSVLLSARTTKERKMNKHKLDDDEHWKLLLKLISKFINERPKKEENK